MPRASLLFWGGRMPDAVVQRPTFRSPVGSFRAVERPCDLLPAMVWGDELLYQGESYLPSFDPGLRGFPWWGVSGYVWPYHRPDQVADEPSELWFALLGVEASPREVDRVLKFIKENKIRTQHRLAEKLGVEVLTCASVPAGDGIVAWVPLHPDPHVADRQMLVRGGLADLFASSSGCDPENALLLMSTDPTPPTLTWDADGLRHTDQYRREERVTWAW